MDSICVATINMYIQVVCQASGNAHGGEVRAYSHTTYSCLDSGQRHNFCGNHHKQLNCPVHYDGHRRK